MIIYLAGGESGVLVYGWRPKPGAHVFVSYYKGDAVAGKTVAIVKANSPELLVIDSGAHSFFGHIGVSVTGNWKPVQSKMPNAADYFARYKRWLLTVHESINYAVELDIQEIVGLDVVKRWRAELETSPMAGKMLWVYHRSDPESEFDRIIHECPSRYIGIEGIRPGQSILRYERFIRKAMDAGCRIHGFAMTKRATLLRYPFYSVDSSSWTYAVRSGKGAVYDAKNICFKLVWLTPHAHAKHGLALPPELHRSKSKDYGVGRVWYDRGEEAFRMLERDVTRVWETRGVSWR